MMTSSATSCRTDGSGPGLLGLPSFEGLRMRTLRTTTARAYMRVFLVRPNRRHQPRRIPPTEGSPTRRRCARPRCAGHRSDGAPVRRSRAFDGSCRSPAGRRRCSPGRNSAAAPSAGPTRSGDRMTGRGRPPCAGSGPCPPRRDRRRAGSPRHRGRSGRRTCSASTRRSGRRAPPSPLHSPPA